MQAASRFLQHKFETRASITPPKAARQFRQMVHHDPTYLKDYVNDLDRQDLQSHGQSNDRVNKSARTRD